MANRNAICDACWQCQMIRSTFKLLIHCNRPNGYICLLLKCLVVEIWWFSRWRYYTDRPTTIISLTFMGVGQLYALPLQPEPLCTCMYRLKQIHHHGSIPRDNIIQDNIVHHHNPISGSATLLRTGVHTILRPSYMHNIPVPVNLTGMAAVSQGSK